MPPSGENPVRILRLIWLAFLIAVPTYAVVLAVLVGQPGAPPMADVNTLRNVFIVLTVGAIVAVYVLRARVSLGERDPARINADPQAVSTTYIMCWAMSETAALFGLILGMLSRSLAEAQPFLLVSAALLLWQRPRPAHFAAR